MSITVKNNIKWVGKIDWELRQFHGDEYSTHNGSSYNSYLIQEEKVALLDTVWQPFVKEFVENLAREIDLTKIDYVICNHAENAICLIFFIGHFHESNYFPDKEAEIVRYLLSIFYGGTCEIGCNPIYDMSNNPEAGTEIETTKEAFWGYHLKSQCPKIECSCFERIVQLMVCYMDTAEKLVGQSKSWISTYSSLQ